MSHDPQGIVYLVDDESVVREALAFLLGSRGLLVYGFASGSSLAAIQFISD